MLLLHLCDVKKELKDNLIDISLNKKISERHTFVSNEVSKRAHHGKGHLNSEKNYLNNVPIAIKRAKDFSCTEEELISNIGTNIGVLITRLNMFQPLSMNPDIIMVL